MPRFYTRTQERQRRTVRRILERSNIWDAATMRIDPEGEVSALKDPNKTFREEGDTRHLVGNVRDIMGEEYPAGRRN